MPGRFVDSNVVLYMVLDDRRKAALSRDMLNSGCVISVQVLNEVTNVLRRKLRMPWPDVRDFLSLIRDLTQIVPVTAQTHEAGINIAERFGFSIYDSMIVAAAMQSGCDTLFSEDLQHGQVIDELVTVRNPFLPAV